MSLSLLSTTIYISLSRDLSLPLSLSCLYLSYLPPLDSCKGQRPCKGGKSSRRKTPPTAHYRREEHPTASIIGNVVVSDHHRLPTSFLSYFPSSLSRREATEGRRSNPLPLKRRRPPPSPDLLLPTLTTHDHRLPTVT
ncbi:unnamed protein product [Lactuca virosa]|uniref:Uncharacterized protein n=1 Tax=Lactuca virosa TaxID=75947 RepID=A0AAU9PEH4_9ASTR|nr:unnamed protein product [Lactuca virosa]